MGYFIITVVLAIIVSFGVLVSLSGVIATELYDGTGSDPKTTAHRRGPALAFLGVGVVLFCLLTVISSYKQVSYGHVGVETQFGQIIGQVGSGAHFIAPWRGIETQNVQIQKAQFRDPQTDAEKKNPVDFLGRINAASAQAQSVYFDVTLNWQVTPDQVQSLYVRFGPNFFTTLVPSRMNQYFKQETVKYEATEALQKRELIRQDVASTLSNDLKANGITVVSLQVDNVSFNPDFEASIEQKQKATQDALTAQNQVQIHQSQAAQAVADAKGKADAAIEAARGDAQSTLLRADAQAQANQKLSASLTPQLIQSQAVQALAAGQVKTVVIPSGTSLLDLSGTLAGLKP